MSPRSSTPGCAYRRLHTRRGVSSVLAMMFLVIFGSLAAAMAVVAQGNLRTADSAMKVSRAMSAAETGLVFASRRLESESRRFVIEKGVIDYTYGSDLWDGSFDEGTDGNVDILPADGFSEPGTPTGLAEAIFNAHLADTHIIVVQAGDEDLPAIDANGTMWAPPIALMSDGNGGPDAAGPYFRLKYELAQYAGEPFVKVTSLGVDGSITRTLQMDFQIQKRIEFAIISPNRIMIGKNVRVEGPLGTRYGLIAGELDTANGDPVVMRSDFYWLDPNLDNKLDILHEQVVAYDVDGDTRLRLYHPTEGQGPEAYPSELVDHDENEYVDDFDLFLAFYDTSPTDRGVVYDSALAGGATEEFDVDLQLARLIDQARPDRDGDGLEGQATDIALGYRDGVIDASDVYAKVRGRLTHAVTEAAWETAHGDSYKTVVQGPIVSRPDEALVTFEASDEDLRELTTDMFSDSQTWFAAQVPADAPVFPVIPGPAGPADFNDQGAAGIAAGGTYTAPGATTWESIPFEAQGAYDWYQRPRYANMTFRNVRIPRGNNGLYTNCTFIGVTYVETAPACTDQNWNYAGALDRTGPPGGPYTYQPKFPGTTADLAGVGTLTDTKPYSNNVRFHACTFIGSVSGVKPDEYTHWRNKVQLTGETRFYIDADDPDLDTQADADDIRDAIETLSVTEITELSKSSILLPGWSADIGNFTNEQAVDPEDTPKVKLKGTIVAGILDVRGTADVFGTMLMTFRPTEESGPLAYGGLPDAFNTTIGYFGPSDGDGEGVDTASASFTGFGEITLRYDPDAKLPDGIPWPITVLADPMTYLEGGEL